ncbi:MAG: ribose 5-phosphate isomerase B [Pirellulaceae bacterium]|nr:ribose 5-phosphate isomerase B [Pirellulaceae bacterium]
MRISIGSDHRGTELKAALVECAKQLGHEVTDEGPCNTEPVDYPDIAAVAAKKVSAGSVDRGILICGTGIGMAITANKFPHVRAAVVDDEATARVCRQHNDTNVLCLNGDLPQDAATVRQHMASLQSVVKAWLETPFEGGRHARRVEKIGQYEKAACEGK